MKSSLFYNFYMNALNLVWVRIVNAEPKRKKNVTRNMLYMFWEIVQIYDYKKKRTRSFIFVFIAVIEKAMFYIFITNILIFLLLQWTSISNSNITIKLIVEKFSKRSFIVFNFIL